MLFRSRELTELFVPVLESHGIKVTGCFKCPVSADFAEHSFSMNYVKNVVALTRERATFVADIWNIASYLFIAPSEFESFGVKAGAATEKPAGPVDPRAKVYDDSLTAPFLAKDVDKFWKDENPAHAAEAAAHVCALEGDFSKERVEATLEEYIKEQGWPMGKVMNCLRLALAGTANGLGIADIVSIIGREQFATRMEYIRQRLG